MAIWSRQLVGQAEGIWEGLRVLGLPGGRTTAKSPILCLRGFKPDSPVPEKWLHFRGRPMSTSSQRWACLSSARSADVSE